MVRPAHGVTSTAKGWRVMAVLDREKAERKRAAEPNQRARKHPAPPSAPKPNPVLRLRTRLNLKQAEFSRLFPFSVRSLATFEGGAQPSEGVRRRLVELERLTNALSEVIKPAAIGEWLKTPNGAFEGLKPLEVIERGESDRIWSMVYYLRSGVPS